MKLENIITKDYLEKEYIKKKLSTLKIATRFGCCSETIRVYLKKFHIPRRSYKEACSGELNPMYGVHRFGNDNPNFKTGYCCDINLCEKCGIKLGDPRSECCTSCANTGINNPMYFNGLGYAPYSSEFNQKLKQKIKERDNFTCQCCGTTEKEHFRLVKQNLPVHHIDYNKFNCIDTNLITVCKLCNNSANGNRDYWFAYYTYIMEGRFNYE